MNRIFTRIAHGLMLAFVVVSLSACDAIGGFNLDSFLKPTSYDEAYNQAATAKAPTVSSPTIISDGVLTVGLKSNAIAPLAIQDTDGTLMGIDVDLASKLAQEMGLKVRFVEVGVTADAIGTNCDIIMDVEAGEDASVTVVGSYAETAATFFHKGEPTSVNAADLEGKTVALQDGSLSQQALHNTGINMVETTFGTLNDAFAALDAGATDYVLCEAYPGAYLAAVTGGISYAGTLEVPSAKGIGVATDNTTLQASVQTAFDSIRSNGIMDLIRSKWIAGAAPLTNADMVADIPEPSVEEVQESEGEETAEAEGEEYTQDEAEEG